jgi:hypothetical protein
MAHFAEVDENNIVLRVLVVADEQEHRGQEYLAVDMGKGGTWIQTSYNTFRNEHKLGGTPLRGNYAGRGWHYDPAKDIFFQPKPYPSWVFSDEVASFVAPVPMPTDNAGYIWNETLVNWEAVG